MRKIDYLTYRKRKNWSSIIDQIPLYWSKNNVFVNHVSNFKSLLIFAFSKPSDLIVINHSISLLRVLIVCPWKLTGKVKVILLKHESEQVIASELSFIARFRKVERFTHLFRYSIVLRILDFMVDERIVLNSRQGIWKSIKYKQLNFLGIDEDRFQPRSCDGESDCVLLAHSPKRREKNIKPLVSILEDLCLEWSIPDGIPNEKMVDFYANGNILFYGNAYETYGLTLIEAMLCNKVIVVGENIGLIMNLLATFSRVELRDYGIFVYGDVAEIQKDIAIILSCSPNSRLFALEQGLTLKAAADRLLKSIC